MEASNKPLFSIMGDSISTYAGCNPEGYDVFYEGERRAATGVCSASDTWWARMVDLLGGRLLRTLRFPEAWSKERAFLRETARSASRRWETATLLPTQLWCSWGLTTTDGEGRRPRLPLARGRFPSNRAGKRASAALPDVQRRGLSRVSRRHTLLCFCAFANAILRPMFGAARFVQGALRGKTLRRLHGGFGECRSSRITTPSGRPPWSTDAVWWILPHTVSITMR